MMHEQPGLDFHDRKSAHAALERAKAKRELIEWLRRAAADRSGSTFWYVVRTKGDSAELVADRLDKLGIEAWCPMRKAVKRLPRRRCKVPVETALFDRYLFVQLPEFEGAFLGVMTVDGVDCLLGTEAGPERVPAAIIEAIQGYVAAVPLDRSRMLAAGDLARVTGGPFAGLIGRALSAEGLGGTVDVEIDLFGQMTPCRIGVDDLEKLD